MGASIKRNLLGIIAGITLATSIPINGCGESSIIQPVILPTLEDMTFGTDETFDVITWNILAFPQTANTVDYVSRSIKALKPEVVAFQEIDSGTAFNALDASLDNYSGFRANSAPFGQNLAVLYNPNEITINSIYEILTEDSSAFPRSPLVIDLTYKENQIYVINNHLKCCSGEDNEARRREASLKLDEYITQNLSDKNVIVFGDLNDSITDPESSNVFWNLISQSDKYLFADMDIALNHREQWSYSGTSHIDHILITNELFDEFADSSSEIKTILIEKYLLGESNGAATYSMDVSDHRPVGIRLKTN